MLSVPNISEGRDSELIEKLSERFCTAGATLVDVHGDRDHNRSVFTLTGQVEQLIGGVLAGAELAIESIDLSMHRGQHPRVGVLDVAPLVYTEEVERATARTAALELAERLGSELELPVYLYGELASSPERVERAYYRKRVGGEVTRVEAGLLGQDQKMMPDYGPQRYDPGSGVTLVTARPPLVAFNINLVSDDLGEAKVLAATLREADELPGLKTMALHIEQSSGVQISINVERPAQTPLRMIVERVIELSGDPESVANVEIVGTVSEEALEGLEDVARLGGFDRKRQIIENLGQP